MQTSNQGGRALQVGVPVERFRPPEGAYKPHHKETCKGGNDSLLPKGGRVSLPPLRIANKKAAETLAAIRLSTRDANPGHVFFRDEGII